MATQLQLRRGTAAENAVFTGAEGELTMSTDTKALQIHDGSTTGGFMVDTVVAFQKPTAGNNYTWYRKYASGWVEQGGIKQTTNARINVTLPVEMSDSNYTIQVSSQAARYAVIDSTNVPTATTFEAWISDNYNGVIHWEVKGLAA